MKKIGILFLIFLLMMFIANIPLEYIIRHVMINYTHPCLVDDFGTDCTLPVIYSTLLANFLSIIFSFAVVSLFHNEIIKIIFKK